MPDLGCQGLKALVGIKRRTGLLMAITWIRHRFGDEEASSDVVYQAS